MDHAEEQELELQALQAIYMDDFKSIEADATTFELVLVPETGADDNHVSLALVVEYTQLYPEEPPRLSCRPVLGLAEEQVKECEQMLWEAASSDELLGTAMVYMLAERAQGWLAERNVPETRDMHAEMLARLELQRSGEDGDRGAGDGEGGSAGGGKASGFRGRGTAKKASAAGEGDWRLDPTKPPGDEESYTPVTMESFAAWRKEWDAEQKQRRDAALAASMATKKGGKSESELLLTGRMLFERSGSMLVMQDAGELGDDEEDAMAAPREAVEVEGDEDDEDEEEGDELQSTTADSVLAEVGDSALFDEDDLPDEEGL